MGNGYVLVAPKEKKYVTFMGYDGEREILLNHFTAKIALGFLRLYDLGYGGKSGVFAFIGKQWNPFTVFDDVGILTIDRVYEEYEDVTQEVINDLFEDEILSLDELPKSSRARAIEEKNE